MTQGDDAARVGTLHATHERANGNGGHLFGTALPADQKAALIEYLKTL